MISNVLYVFSISLQVAGALLLVLFSISTNRKDVIKRFIGKRFVVQSGKEIDYNHEEFINEYRNSYLNKLAFIYISIGYLIGIFADTNEQYLYLIFIFIILLTGFIMLLSVGVITKYVKCKKTINSKITSEELLKYNLEPNLQTITKEDIDSYWNDN